MKILIGLVVLFCPLWVLAFTVSGSVQDEKGAALPFSIVLIKGSSRGTTANAKGHYSLKLEKGSYTLVCKQIGFKTIEKKIDVEADLVVDFVLEHQSYDLKEVVVSNKSEDPAYEIIRKTIRKRVAHLKEMNRFSCDVYLKGQLQLRSYPKKLLGDTVDFEDGDTSKRKMIFLSETMAHYSSDGDKKKVEVTSTRVSGSSDGFGFSSPNIIPMYENIVPLGSGLNPRGFLSPIGDNALNFYKYKFVGTFYENGKEISRIKVIPRRKYEPLFEGYINIVENEWSLQSVELMVLKAQQMQLLDTLIVEQLYIPHKKNWVIKQQMVYPKGKFFGFDFFGSFLQVYDKFDEEAGFGKKYFDNTIIRFADSSNKKPKAYWDSVRPVPLLEEERRDYVKKDSIEVAHKSPKYLDSIDRVHNKITFKKVVLTGVSIEHQAKKLSYSFAPLLASGSSFNTVEGYWIHYKFGWKKNFGERKNLSISPMVRYGFSNGHFNAWMTGKYGFGKRYSESITVSGGKRVFQFDRNNPISDFDNSVASLFYTRNYAKLYEGWFGMASWNRELGSGVTVAATGEFEDRAPLVNTSDYYFQRYNNRKYTANDTREIAGYETIAKHKALTATLGLSWKPGMKYIAFPNRTVGIGSKFPLFTASITQGIHGLLNSDVDFTKWRLGVNGGLNLHLIGSLQYRLETGGFLNSNKVFTPDLTHFEGNLTGLSSSYLNSFQLLPYYKYSNAQANYSRAHVEYHLNGFLTNKIPGYRKLNWFFVVGGNALWMNNVAYYESFLGIENIFKVIRIDGVQSHNTDGNNTSGIRVSIPLFKGAGGAD